MANLSDTLLNIFVYPQKLCGSDHSLIVIKAKQIG